MVKYTFLGTGPSEGVSGMDEEKSNRTNSSLLVEHNDKDILFDCSPDYTEQVNKEDLANPDYVFIGHAHDDCIGGLNELDAALVEEEKEVELFAEKETIEHIKETFESEFESLEFIEIEPLETVNRAGIEITPLRVKHREEYPTVAYKIDDLVYMEDMESIEEDVAEYLDEAKVIAIDAAIFNLEKNEEDKVVKNEKDIVGHNNVTEALQILDVYSPKIGILTQIGQGYPEYSKAKDMIDEYYDGNINIELAYDGMVLKEDDFKTSEKEKEKSDKLDLSDFKDFTIINDAVSVVGSAVDMQDRDPDDLDLLVRIDPKYEYLRRAITTKLKKLHPGADVIFEPMGSGDTFMPLYDLMLKRKNHDKEIVEMNEIDIKLEESSCEPLESFKPMKPRDRYYKIDDVVKELY